MIFIEVRFGAINGNAIDVDQTFDAESQSTNPLSHKAIAEALAGIGGSTIEDIEGLTDALAAKQNAAGNTALQTSDKTIVGAINEVYGLRKLIYSVNFYGMNDAAIEHNLTGRALSLSKIVTSNVATLKYSILNGAQDVSVPLTNGAWTKSSSSTISIPDNAEVTWKITRVDDSKVAEITIKEA